MTVTSQLLKLFRVDQQLRGLRSRLTAAERFLEQQKRQLAELEAKASSIDAQVRQLRVTVSGNEGEAARLEQRMNAIREQMNSAKTSKEYNALLTELGNFKDEKSELETAALESLTKVEELEKQAEGLTSQRAEREGIVRTAEADRATKEAEIKDRLEELTRQRREVAKEIATSDLALLEQLISQRGDEAMASVEVLDRRNHEYACTACMMTLPMETINGVVNGRLTRCVNCGCILFTEEELVRPKHAGKS